jgi:hypothetical protein
MKKIVAFDYTPAWPGYTRANSLRVFAVDDEKIRCLSIQTTANRVRADMMWPSSVNKNNLPWSSALVPLPSTQSSHESSGR